MFIKDEIISILNIFTALIHDEVHIEIKIKYSAIDTYRT